MVPKVQEYLDGSISIKLKKNNNLIINQFTDRAAVEIVGRTDRLIKNVK